ncbi:MAG: NifB/NifX family molybdenum-iron cluster-binding protein [Elusimicrobia bacterium]|nr:NifB/NifX family molybdenum-iron cluster-binding protein [Elusimicrobiota bacterium]
MKICLTATGEGPESHVDPRFGRCGYFVFHDTGTGGYEAVKNNAAGAPHGAGIQSAQLVIERRPDVVITGNIGPNASSVLSAAGIKVVTFGGGTVEEAVMAMAAGKLRAAEGPTVPGHHGTGGGIGQGKGRGGNRSRGA